LNICTIIAKNYVAQARVLAESFNAAHPEGNCTVLIIDDPDGFIDPAAEPFELLTIDRIGLPDPERMAASYNVLELSTAVKPWLLRTLLERPGVDSIAYLDPDIRVFAPLDEVERRAREHGVVLTPHFTEPLPRDDEKPSEEDILIAGTYNLGFIGMSEGETTEALLDWWSERLEHHCIVDPERGRFVDQRWIDLAPGLWPGIDLLRDPGFNVAYWNLPTRRLEIAADGGYRVNGSPLKFFHFSGFDPRRPDELSKHQTRVDLAADPTLSRICGEYGEALLEQGFEEAVSWPYGWEKMANGIKIDNTIRRLHREAVEEEALTDSVFKPRGAQELMSYMNSPADGRDGNGSFNRYAETLWELRPDLRRAFPDLSGDDREGYLRWMHEFAGDNEILAPYLRSHPVEGPVLPPSGPSGRTPPKPKPGVNLIGYLSAARGVGEAARQVDAALRESDLPVATIDAPTDAGELPVALGSLGEKDHPYDFNLICVNADMLPAVAVAAGRQLFEGRHTAGLWFWEVTDFPEQWFGAFNDLDEVWVASDHIAGALRPVSPIPIETVRMPIAPAPAAAMDRAELGMPEGYCFLFVFDYRSVFRRKNPLGLVAAFCQAFEPGEGPSLVIKSICGEEFPAEREALAAAVADRPEIVLIEEKIPVAAKNAMIATCDCYVSLHRSEGLGLTMGEAMHFGRPVIATGYSGNLDFMTEENSFLVRHSPTKIGPDAPPYPADGEWAEPDVEHAAELMRRVYEDPGAAAEKGRRAAAEIRRTHSFRALRESIEQRVHDVWEKQTTVRVQAYLEPEAEPGPSPPARDQLEHLLSRAELPPQHGAGRLRGSAKRLYMRLLRPYVAYQQRVNASTAASLDELREQLAEVLELQGARAKELRGSSSHHRDTVEAVKTALSQTERQVRELRKDLDRTRAERERILAAKPYMSDQGLAPREHPLLGETTGFRSGSGRERRNGYRGFEDVFRGSEEMIRERQRVYLDLVADHAPVLDAGCGRGEFLDLLAERGIESKAVDLDAGMVARCREKGHQVEEGDLIEFLERCPEGSLGAVFSAQVIEHLDHDQLQRFLELALSRLRPGGLLVVETVNPHSPTAMKTFWVDPTHVRPLFPETMLVLCELAGYATGDVFAPLGNGDWERDRKTVGEYGLVAAAPARGS
jgi:2-polyprenyl-3-methyl-5-hydroxy-6-metoxy-1,4-benzoquinol methylase